MTTLPASIEAYLADAGFSSTEILVLKNLLEGEALTLRELASKTGKSTGVLDQATKKLLARRILSKEVVNDTSKLLLKSLDAIRLWMEEDMEHRMKAMRSRAKDFESFVSSLKLETGRPEIEHFDGRDGITKAYLKLLTLGGKEMLRYRPAPVCEEEDPLRAFYVQFFRERHRRGIFERALAPDVALGKRLQSRDPFEYRKTLLLPEEGFPVSFEKIIVNGTVACFNHAQERACFLHYPDLAMSERNTFELLWRQASSSSPAEAKEQEQPVIPWETRTFSAFREFLVSRKSLVAMALCGVLAAGVTLGLYSYTSSLSFRRLQDRVKSIVETGALQFDARDLEQLQVQEDYKKPEWKETVNNLKEIRLNNKSIVFAYIFRKQKSDASKLEFVADSHSINPFANTDDDSTNDVDPDKNGVIEPNGPDKLQWPGQPYPVPNKEALLAFKQTIANDRFYEDSWGTYLSGYAPIRNDRGETVAVLAVDVSPEELQTIISTTIMPWWIFFFAFLLFVSVRLAAFNRPLFLDLLRLLRSKKILITLGMCGLIALGVTYGMYLYTLNLMKEEVGTRLMSIAATAAPTIDAKDLNELHIAEDMKKEAYQRVFKKLNEIRDRNEHVKWVYVMRPTDNPQMWEFVADANANFYIPFEGADENKDGKIDEMDENVAPGVAYDATGQGFTREALKGPSYSGFATDQWGTFLTGLAPIIDENNQGIAVLGLDMEVSDFYKQIRDRFVPYWWFGGTLVVSIILLMIFQSLRFTKIFGQPIRSSHR